MSKKALWGVVSDTNLARNATFRKLLRAVLSLLKPVYILCFALFCSCNADHPRPGFAARRILRVPRMPLGVILQLLRSAGIPPTGNLRPHILIQLYSSAVAESEQTDQRDSQLPRPKHQCRCADVRCAPPLRRRNDVYRVPARHILLNRRWVPLMQRVDHGHKAAARPTQCSLHSFALLQLCSAPFWPRQGSAGLDAHFALSALVGPAGPR